MSSKFTVRDFFQKYHNENVCLDHVMNVRYGMKHTCRACERDASFYRVTGRKAYACGFCGDHVYPCVSTIFENSQTKLQLWFYAIFLFVVTRHGVSGKELERQLGVTYKCAHRMGHKIRDLTKKADFHTKLIGHIEVDEAYVGGKRPGKRGRGAAGKTIVVGMKQREGAIKTAIVSNVRKVTLQKVVTENVERGSIVSTDELPSYNLLKTEGYTHGVVKHAAKQYVSGIHHVNGVEGFWKLFKDSVRSTHIHISKKYADKYLSEFTFRANHRHMQNAMFDLLIASV